MRSRRILTLAGLGLVAVPLSGQKPPAATCNRVSLAISLKAGETYKQRLNDLTFKMSTWLPKSGEPGWTFSLEDADHHDYIYPVNPPLRFNPSQYLGAAYGESARQSLKTNRELRFLLAKKDYDHLWPFLTNALWPYSAPRPDRAGDEYTRELGRLRTGLLRLNITKSDISAEDVIRSAEFQVEFVAPSDFHFDPQLKPQPSACPAGP